MSTLLEGFYKLLGIIIKYQGGKNIIEQFTQWPNFLPSELPNDCIVAYEEMDFWV